MKVGFIGLGAMGRPMALNLLKGGHQVTVWARRAESMQPLLDASARGAGSPAEAARSNELVISMVADAPDVAEVMRGVAQGAAPGLVAVDMSTIAPAAARQIGVDLAAAGVDFMDAPVSGGNLGAMGASGWQIGIRDPFGEGLLASLATQGREAVVTSGSYERFRMLDGERCTHILDPSIAAPAQGLVSVTVLHRSAALADAAALVSVCRSVATWSGR